MGDNNTNDSNNINNKKKEFYKELVAEAGGVVAGETDAIANMANISSLVYHALNKYVLLKKQTKSN